MSMRRDGVVAAAGFAAALCVVAIANTAPATLHSAVFAWDAAPEKTTEVGSVRSYFRAPTATLAELEYHATTLKPGLASHPPHRHPNEEIVIIKEGTVEALVNDKWLRLGPGALIFNASNELHGLRNVGDQPAVYHVINWSSKK
jgi:quercetin dioxygenase-like cupin family protein